ncbi:MAG TPA: hypothetical protein VKC62_06895 [Gaiellaceae bacterium]|nr:hypothetical protein [Gaiellaceae bacterium]
MSTGPLPAGITDDLEALKRRLVAMSAHDMTPEETNVIAEEISAIRLQLKRLAADQDERPAV